MSAAALSPLYAVNKSHGAHCPYNNNNAADSVQTFADSNRVKLAATFYNTVRYNSNNYLSNDNK